MTEPGKHLANTIIALNKSVSAILDEENKLSREAFKTLLTDTVDQLMAEFQTQEEVKLTQTSLNLLLMALSQYSIFERLSYDKSGNSANFDKLGRNNILQTAFKIMMDQVALIEDVKVTPDP